MKQGLFPAICRKTKYSFMEQTIRHFNSQKDKNLEHKLLLRSEVPNLFLLAYPQAEIIKLVSTFVKKDIFFENLGAILKLMKIWRTP